MRPLRLTAPRARTSRGKGQSAGKNGGRCWSARCRRRRAGPDDREAERGKLAESNAQQVTKARQIVEGLGLEIASSEEAREILALKGGDKVGF